MVELLASRWAVHLITVEIPVSVHNVHVKYFFRKHSFYVLDTQGDDNYNLIMIIHYLIIII